jgi:hypothetical protein
VAASNGISIIMIGRMNIAWSSPGRRIVDYAYLEQGVGASSIDFRLFSPVHLAHWVQFF